MTSEIKFGDVPDIDWIVELIEARTTTRALRHSSWKRAAVKTTDPDYAAFLTGLPKLRRVYDPRLLTDRGDSLDARRGLLRDIRSVTASNRQMLKAADRLRRLRSRRRAGCAVPCLGRLPGPAA